jgi:molybdenum cofactor biosynthesis protein B
MQNHKRNQKIAAVVSIIVTSDRITEESDKTGKLATRLLVEAGHSVSRFKIVKNDVVQIKKTLQEFLDDEKIQVIITSGGTGISSRDKTVSVVSKFLERKIEGFGELFRRISYDEIGVPSILSRTIAGISNKKIVFCLPGSPKAIKTALEEIIIPVLGHLLWELNR